jgi:hypothetical protein
MGRKKATDESDVQEQERLFAPPKAGLSTDAAWFSRRYLVRSLEVFLYWMPVWVPLILLAQIGTRGLKPARQEEDSLLEKEEKLSERLEADEVEARELGDQREALDDEVYLERLRRQRQDRQRADVEDRGLAPQPEVEGTENAPR